MAVLTNAQAKQMWQTVFIGDDKPTIKAEGDLPRRDVLRNMFQVCEDFTTTNLPTLKTDIETQLGREVSTDYARKIIKGYFYWKLGTI